MLRRRRGDETPPTISPCTVPSPAFLSMGEQESTALTARDATQTGAGDPPPQGSASRRSRDASIGELEPRIARIVRKLASKRWVLLYDSLKAMFALQAEGIAREVVFEAMAAAAAAGAAVMNEAEKGPQQQRRVSRVELEGLRRCIAAWEVYKDWCEEVRHDVLRGTARDFWYC